ncbi:MAG: choice-of-anchor tandem repeat GloVer-containing protein, partial [Candidatus Cybelea sp.]
PVAVAGQGALHNDSASLAKGQAGFRVLYSFQDGDDGAVPSSGLIADKSGNLYGTTTNVGGVTSCNVHCGSIFELSPPASKHASWSFTILYDFTGGKDGGLPQGGLMFGRDGTLYGTANVGGRYGKFGDGVLFQLKAAKGHWTEKVLHDFGRGNDGRNPHGGLEADGKGNLYGTTANGGKYFSGTVYDLSLSSKAETVLYNFSGGEDGGTPLAGLTIDHADRLYGTTNYGGYFSYYCQAGCGTVFEVSPPATRSDHWNYAVIHEFVGGVPGDGALPLDPLLLDGAGNLYGTTFLNQGAGGGTAFELTPGRRHGSWTETVLYRFPAFRGDAVAPSAGFISDSGDNLYATSQNGGLKFKGDVFKLIPPAKSSGAWTDAILHTFSSARDGTYPSTNLIFGAAGLLYGTTPYGGTGDCVFTKIKGCGTVFQVGS